MPSPLERLHIEVETIAQSDSPSLMFTAVSPEGLPHSATVWFAPTDNLDLLLFSSPTRVHSQHIERSEFAGQLALVSGALRVDRQRKSHPDQHGLTFEGTADRLRDPDEIESALSRFLLYGTFEESEIDKYLNHPTNEIPPHGVYIIRPNLWTIFDARLGPNNPDRLINLAWPIQ